MPAHRGDGSGCEKLLEVRGVIELCRRRSGICVFFCNWKFFMEQKLI
jgi:hypothetical protein